MVYSITDDILRKTGKTAKFKIHLQTSKISQKKNFEENLC